MSDLIRWGILGPGRIAREFVDEEAGLEGSSVVALASRSAERGQAFAREYGIQRVYTDYRDLLNDPNVDLIYIATPHNFHCEWAIAALNAGKGVFCEKPLGISLREVDQMIEAARRNQRFLMEAVTTPFMPAVREAKNWLEAGRIGAPKLLHAFFCFDRGEDDIEDRLLNPALAGGASLDLGVYPLSLVRCLLGADLRAMQSTVEYASTGVDKTVGTVLRFASGAIAQVTVSIGLEVGAHAVLWGTEGCIELPEFYRATEAQLRDRKGQKRTSFQQDGPGAFRFELEEALRCVRSGKLESSEMSWSASRELAQWQELSMKAAQARQS